MESESGQRITIPRVKPQKAEKRLWVWYSLDGQWKTEYKNWREFTTTFVDKIQMARWDRLGGHHAYKTLWCAKFRYIAPVVSFTKQVLVNIQKKSSVEAWLLLDIVPICRERWCSAQNSMEVCNGTLLIVLLYMNN